MEFVLPLGIILLGVIAMTIYVLVVALRDATRQIVRMNERILIILGTRGGNEAVGRALVASSRPPVKPLTGLSASQGPKDKKKKDPPGMMETMGIH